MGELARWCKLLRSDKTQGIVVSFYKCPLFLLKRQYDLQHVGSLFLQCTPNTHTMKIRTFIESWLWLVLL